MKAALVLPSYILWHYTTALRDIWGILTNFIWFFYHFFSVPILGKTLFAPWHKLGERYKRGFDPAGLASTFLINTILRLVGFVVRIFVLAFAAALMFSLFLVGVLFYIAWLCMPLVLFLFFLLSVNYFSI